MTGPAVTFAAGPQLAGQVAGRARQAGHMIAVRLRGGLGQEVGDTSGAECPPGDCTTFRHREVAFLLLVNCIALIAQMAEEESARRAVAIRACEPGEVRAALAAHRMLSTPMELWVATIEQLDRAQLCETIAGLIECAAGLALELHSDDAPAAVLGQSELITAELVGENCPAYLRHRPWVTSPRSS